MTPSEELLLGAEAVAVLLVGEDGTVLRAGAGVVRLLGRDPTGERVEALFELPGSPVEAMLRAGPGDRVRMNLRGTRDEAVTLDFRRRPAEAGSLLVGEPPSGEADALRDGLLRLNAELGRSGRELTRQAAELARTAEFKDALLALVAWDLRTALDTILSTAGAPAEAGHEPWTPEVRRRMDVIDRTAAHARERLDAILDASDLGIDGLSLRRVATRAGLLAMKALSAVRPLASVGKVVLRWEAPEDDPLVLADRARLLQALGSVLGAVVRRAGRGGVVSCALAVDEGGVRIEVRNSGPGLTRIELDRLLRPYSPVRREERSREATHAVGLGLARLVVVAHGGEVFVEMEGGVARTVVLRLPPAG